MNGCRLKPEQIFNFIFGYNDRYSEDVNATSTGAAGTYAYGTAVPADEVWVVESISFYHNDGAARRGVIGVYDGTRYAWFVDQASLAALTYLPWTGRVTLKAGDKVALYVAALANGKHIVGVAWGYKMKLTQ